MHVLVTRNKFANERFMIVLDGTLNLRTIPKGGLNPLEYTKNMKFYPLIFGKRDWERDLQEQSFVHVLRSFQILTNNKF